MCQAKIVDGKTILSKACLMEAELEEYGESPEKEVIKKGTEGKVIHSGRMVDNMCTIPIMKMYKGKSILTGFTCQPLVEKL